jgi:hypothetical protein
MRHTAEQWEAVRRAVLGGMSMGAAARQFGMTFQAIGERARRDGWHVAEQRCIERGKAQLGRAGELRRRQALAVASVQEVKFEVEQVGEQLRKASPRTKVAIAELAEATLEQLREEPDMSAIERSRALQALANVGKMIHGWDKEPERESEEDPLACKGAINLALMRMTPEQLRNGTRETPGWMVAAGRPVAHRGVGAGGQVPVCTSTEIAESQSVTPEAEADPGMANLMRAFEQRRDRAQATTQQQERERQKAQRAAAKAPPSAFTPSRMVLQTATQEQAPAQEAPPPLYGPGSREWLEWREQSRLRMRVR